MKIKYSELLLLLALPLSHSSILAQSDDEEIFELSPFEVTTEEDGSYIAKNAISATKFDTALKDIPVSLQVITEAFMDDTFSLDLESTMDYSAAVSPEVGNASRETGTFSIRGFSAARVKRDGVIAYYAQELTNVARVEVMKGPASLLYGEAQPGGIINYVPKRPLAEPRYSATVSYGSDSFFRSEVEMTGPLLKGKNQMLLYRIDASYQETDGWKSSKAMEKSFISPVLEYRFWKNAKIVFQYEYLDSRRITTHRVPFGSSLTREQWEQAPEGSALKTRGTYDSTGGTGGTFLRQDSWFAPLFDLGDLANDPRVFVHPVTGRALVVMDEIVDAPYDFVGEHPDDSNRLLRNLYSLDIQTPLFFDGWNLRLFGVYDNPEFDVRQSRPLANSSYSMQSIRYSRGVFGVTDFENNTYHYQAVIKGSWELFGVFNQTVFGGEIRDDSYRGLIYSPLPPDLIANSSQNEFARPFTPEATQNIPAANLFIIENSTHSPIPDPSAARFDFRDPYSEGYYFSNLASFYDDKIKVLFGMRYDRSYQKVFNRDLSFSSRTDTETNVAPQYGIIYAPFESLSLYVSRAESFVPDNSSLTRYDPNAPGNLGDGNPNATPPIPDTDGQFIQVPSPADVGVGKEIGFKIDLWDSKLSGTVAYFDIEQDGVVVSRNTTFLNANGDFITEQYKDGVSTSSGIDMDFSYAPWPELQIIMGYAYIKSETTVSNSGSLVSYEDRLGVSDHQGSIWAKYTFNDGALDGLSIAGGAQYVGNRRLVAPTADSLALGWEDVRIYGEPYIKFDFRLAYSGTFMENKYTLSVNIKNITNEKAFTSGVQPLTPREIFVSLTYKF